VSRKGTLGKARSCKTPAYLTARGNKSWRLELRGAFKRGTYVVKVRATDAVGNRGPIKTATLRMRAVNR
jgi:hypothetical protein